MIFGKTFIYIQRNFVKFANRITIPIFFFAPNVLILCGYFKVIEIFLFSFFFYINTS